MATNLELISALKEIVTPYIPDEVSVDQLERDTDLLKDLQINSAHLVDIILDIEDRFDIEISDEEAENLLTVGAAIDLIESKTSSNGGE